METKRCSDCKETKPLSDFPRNPAQKSGYGGICNPCASARMREWYARNNDFRRKLPETELPAEKACRTCKRLYPATKTFFYGHAAALDGLQTVCKRCVEAYESRNKENRRAQNFARYHARRWAVLSHYSEGGVPCCACCGESHLEFLAIDHIDGGGARHLKEIGAAEICRWLIKRDFPAGFQVLCHNCNMAKGFYGECPHERERKLLSQP